jgi:hypothetical protein
VPGANSSPLESALAGFNEFNRDVVEGFTAFGQLLASPLRALAPPPALLKAPPPQTR